MQSSKRMVAGRRLRQVRLLLNGSKDGLLLRRHRLKIVRLLTSLPSHQLRFIVRYLLKMRSKRQ